MKKKGFTLIELIVVIAIIGVLAAIIVPTMLGYVKKSKITSANTSASEVVKSMNAILSDGTSGDEFRNLTSGDYGFKTNVGIALESISDDEDTSISQYIGEYSDTLASQNFAVYVQDGVVVAAATKSGRYFGTSPAVFTNKTYDSLMNPDTMEQALKLAKEKAGITD